jgi:hypothetical protein
MIEQANIFQKKRYCPEVKTVDIPAGLGTGSLFQLENPSPCF